MRKTRTEIGYRETVQNRGGFCPHLSDDVTKRIVRYCKATDQNKTRFVIDCVNAQLDILEKQALSNYTKEELIEMLLAERS